MNNSPTNSLMSLWLISVDLLKWKNLKLLLLVTLNTFVRSLKILGSQFWWLFIGAAVIKHFFNFSCAVTLMPSLQLYKAGTFFPIDFIISAVFLFLYIATVRPSIELKDRDYYLAQEKWLPGFFIIFGMVYFLKLVAITLFSFVFTKTLGLTAVTVGCVIVFHLMKTIIDGFAGFFFLDKRPCLSGALFALGASIKLSFLFLPLSIALLVPMLLHMLPLFFVSLNFQQLIYSLIASLTSLPLFASTVAFLSEQVLVLLYCSFLATFYTKIKHNHHSLFFGK